MVTIYFTDSEWKYIQKLQIKNKKIRSESKKRIDNKEEYFKTLTKNNKIKEIDNYYKWKINEKKFTNSLLCQGLISPMSPAEKMMRFRIKKKFEKVLDDLEVLNEAGIVFFNRSMATEKKRIVHF